MIMKILFTFIFIIISPNIFASNQDVEKNLIKGEMSCKITSQILISVKDGKPKKHPYIQDEAKVGDTLSIMYSSYNGKDLAFRLKDDTRDYIKGFGMRLDQTKRVLTSKELHFINPGGSYDNGTNVYYHYNRISLLSDKINYKQISRIGSRNLYLERYYKSDWSGVYTQSFSQFTQVITLDCRTISDKIDEITERSITQLKKSIQ